MSRNAENAADFFQLPSDRTVEIGFPVERWGGRLEEELTRRTRRERRTRSFLDVGGTFTSSVSMLKSETTRRICKAIRDVLNGIPYVSKEAASPSDPQPGEEHFDLALLSERELEVFRYLGLGNPTRQIANTLGISIKTVQVHCANIREKLSIPGVTELYGVAVRWNERHREEMG